MISAVATPSAITSFATDGFRLNRRGPAAAGIDDQPRALAVHERLVRVAVDHDVAAIAGEQSIGRWRAELVAVAHVDPQAAQLERQA